jgi:hypothetical protein
LDCCPDTGNNQAIQQSNNQQFKQMIFENAQVPVSELPRAENVDFQSLATNYRMVELIGTTIFFSFLLAGWFVFYFVNPTKLAWLPWLLLAGWGLLFLLGLAAAIRRYAAEGYALREHDILHKHGVWWRTVTAIPYNRMQHCEISRGPVESAFGLATLKVFTAGGSSSDIGIEGLPVEEAQRVKEFITKRIGAYGDKPIYDDENNTQPIE